MKIAFCHNHYRNPGGEDVVFQAESQLMEDRGHEVLRYTCHNDGIDGLSKPALIGKTFWNREVYRDLKDRLGRFQPDIVHFHNTFPLMSPAAYKAARKNGAAVVQTLHNFRMICPGSLLVHNDEPCFRCVRKKLAWPSISRKCYRSSASATAVTVAANAWHRFTGTYNRYVNRFIALSNACKALFVEAGFPPDRVAVKPNFLAEQQLPVNENRRGALFVGRVCREKGLQVLADCWEKHDPGIPLDIVGDGPLLAELKTRFQHHRDVHFHGWLEKSRILEMMGAATVQVVPTICFEPFGLVVIEAFSCGTPVIVSDHGSLPELVQDGLTGLHFENGNPADLARKVRELVATPDQAWAFGKNARQSYLERYTPDRNYELLTSIYESTLEENNKGAKT